MNRILTSLLAVLSLFSAMEAFAQPAPPPLPPGQLLDRWPFSGTNFLSIRQYAPLSLSNVVLVPTWAGNGLQVDATNAASITYAVVATNGHTNLNCSQGTVEMWFSPDWNSDDGLGAWGTLLEAGTWDTNLATGAWGLYLSPDASNLYFSAQSNGFGTNYLSTPIAWNVGDWHHVAITYSASNSALYLEGELVASGAGVSVIPGAAVLTNGFSIGSDGNGTGLLQARGVFNNVITYNYQLSADTISQNYSYDSENVYPLPFSGGGFRTFTMDSSDLPSPLGGSGGSGGSSPSFNSPQYGSNDFWLQALSPGTNVYNSNPSNLTLILHGTIADIEYQILSTTNLQASNTAWTLEQLVFGSEITNFTVTTVPLESLHQKFFKAIAYNYDSTGSGLPDWWQEKYFGSLGVNADGNPMGDGYSNLYKYEHGMNPNTYYTPPAPIATAFLNTNGNIVVSWPAASNLPNNGAGAVAGYTLQTFPDNVSLSASQLSYETGLSDNSWLSQYMSSPSDPANGPLTFSLQVNYTHGNSQWSSVNISFDPLCTVNASITRGSDGALYLAVSSLPQIVTAIRVMSGASGGYYALNDYGVGDGYASYADEQWFTRGINAVTDPTWPIAYFDVPVSSITNGLYQIPPSQAPLFGGYVMSACGIGANGNVGRPVQVSPLNDWDPYYTAEYMGPHNLNIPFLDGRTNIQQNINMFLRGASSQAPFTLVLTDRDPIDSGNLTWYSNLQQPTNYVWDGFNYQTTGDIYNYTIDSFEYGVLLDQRNEFQPFEETTLYTNLIFNLALFDSSGNLNKQLGTGYYGNEVELKDPTKLFDTYNYVANNPSFPLPPLPSAVLDQTAENWICSPGSIYSQGFIQNNDGSYTIPSVMKNIYGLTLQGVKYFGANGIWSVAGPGSSFYASSFSSFQNVTPPTLNTVAYYFARPDIEPLPGDISFSPTNITPPLIIIPFGKQFYQTAWAKQSVLNGYSGVFAFPQQYFDKAYLADANGSMTTNHTGILSEYGDFFPTQPGKVFLTTKPDAATGSVGTNVVNVIKLQLDVNHDGNMDLSFAGTDNTSMDRPFRFWVNSDCDTFYNGPSGLADPGHDAQSPNTPDYADLGINSMRDLEDFARLWIVGMPALPNSSGYLVTLYWTNIVSGSPAINVFPAAEANGGTGYLTDTNMALKQLGWAYDGLSYSPDFPLARISTGPVSNQIYSGPFTFPAYYFTNGAPKYFLFEGAGVGKGELVLSVALNGTNIASTSAFLDLKEVSDMIERAHITNAPTTPPSTTLADQSTFVLDNNVPMTADDGSNIVVFVHGWRVTPWVAENFAETMFKRLWWQGYQGRYAALRWPTLSSETDGPAAQYLTFNRDEYISFNCAKGAASYFTNLQGRFPNYGINVCAHSHGNVLMMEVLKSLLASGQTPIHNYALLQAAVAAECLDTNAALYPSFIIGQTPLPDAFYGYAGPIQNALATRNGVPGKMFNFYNTNDFGVVTCWEPNQLLLKPDGRYAYAYFTNTPYKTSVGSARVVTDPHEVMAFLSRPKTQAAGAVAGLGGSLSAADQVDVQALVGFTDHWDEHSGEFNWTIQKLNPFYRTLAQRLGIVPLE